MLFSIIIPCYNSEAYLQKLFNCLKSQTYGMEKLEIICVDDGSTDGTFKHLQAYSESYPNVHVITQANAGVSTARNVGIQAATGQWIVFIDADDWVSPNFFSELASAITKYPNVLVHFTACATHHESTGREKLMRNSAPQTVVATDKEGVQLFDLDDHNELFRVIWRMAFNTALLRRYNLLFDTGIRFGEDTLFHFEYLACIRDYVEQQEKLQAVAVEQVASEAEDKTAVPTMNSEGLPTNPVRLASYLSKAIYFYFKVAQVRGRAHDMHQKDLIQAGYIYNERHFDLGQRRGFDANFLNEMFKHVGFSVVFALSFSKNLTNYTPERRQDIVRYLKSLRDWMVIFRDLGLTHKFLEVVSKQEFYVRSRAIPQSLYLQAVACNPHRINQSIAHFQLETQEEANSSTAVEARVVSESVIANFTRRLKKSFIKFFTGKDSEIDSVEQPIGAGQTANCRTFDISSINNLPVNHANEVDFLYYNTIYYGDQAYLSILTNATRRLEAKLDEIKFNKKNITRSSPYRVYGIQLGQQILINLSLLSAKETKQLLGFCADLRKHNLFDYEERAIVKVLGKLLKGVSTKTKNFVVYDEQGTKLETMQQLLSHLGPQGNHHGLKLINSFELGYPVNVAAHSFTVRDAQLAIEREAAQEAARQAELGRQVEMEIQGEPGANQETLDAVASEQVIASSVKYTTTEVIAEISVATQTDSTVQMVTEENTVAPTVVQHSTSSVTVDAPSVQALEVEVVHQANAPILATSDALDTCDGTVAHGMKFTDIFAAYRIRGFTPSEYDLIYRPMNVARLIDNRSIGGAMNFYMDYGRANSIALPLSLLLNRQFAAEKLFTRRAPLYDCLVVVDCEVSDFVFESLALSPNLRLIFPDVETYNSWLEALVLKSASVAEVSQHQVNATLYQKHYEQWQLLRRAFVLVAA